MKRVTIATVAAAAIVCLATAGWADEGKGHGKRDYGKSGHGAMDHGKGFGMPGHHGGTGHFLRHLLKHQKDIGLSEGQVAKIKAIQLELDKTRIKTEADIEIAERELHAMLEDEKSDLNAIESKVIQSESLEVDLRMAAIKAKRDALAVLTPEQRAKEQAEHEKMMGRMSHGQMGGMGHGTMPGGHGMAMPSHPKGDGKKDDKH